MNEMMEQDDKEKDKKAKLVELQCGCVEHLTYKEG